jgi:hypothetical protein
MPTGQLQAWPNNWLDRAVKLTRIAAIVVCALVWTACSTAVQPSGQNGDSGPVGRAFNSRESGVHVEGEGVITRILEDDLTGSRHQRFIVRLSSGQTVLITHNIDVAPRVEGIQEGDSVSFYGVYEWNEKGGTVHWTHHDPQGKHVPGWLKHNGRTYQ